MDFLFKQKYIGHCDAVHWTAALNFINCFHVVTDFSIEHKYTGHCHAVHWTSANVFMLSSLTIRNFKPFLKKNWLN